jgi:SAM-dependent methyltransferase
MIGDSSKDRVLDIGCGTAQILEFLTFKDYVGIDKGPAYIQYAKKKYTGNVRFECMDALSSDFRGLGVFDLALALGFFHHVPDQAFESVLKKIRGVLHAGARLVSFDPCHYNGQSPLSKFFVSMDRGEYVRSFDRYVEIARGVFPDTKAVLWTGKLRIPYAHCVMEMK